MSEKETLSNKKALLLIFIVVFPSIIIIGIIHNELFIKNMIKDESIQIMINYEFENGTIMWIDSNSEIPYITDQGKELWKPIVEVLNIKKLNSYQEKTINYDTGKIDYVFKHIDFIGSKVTGN